MSVRLSVLAISLTLLAALLNTPVRVMAEPLEHRVAASRVIDLTHAMHDAMPYWPGGVPFTKTRLVDYDGGYRLHKFEVGENTGTHVDAPAHFDEGNRSIDALSLNDLVVRAVVIDVTAQVDTDPDYRLSPGDITAWEAQHGVIPEGSLVILNTGWHKRFGDPKAYINMDESGVMHFPGFHSDSANLLIERGVRGVGIDSMSLDHGPAAEFTFHKAMLGAGKYQIENLANLDALPATGVTIIIGVLPVKDGSQAQARILGLLP